MEPLDKLSLVEIIDRTESVNDISQPALPYCCPIPGGNLHPGSVITIYGTCPSDQGRFRIDLYASNCQHCRSEDGRKSLYDKEKRLIALHFNVRFKEDNGKNYILMNSYHNGKWDKDQRDMNHFPFVPNQPFCLMILTEMKRFRIYVDGSAHANYEFQHRFPVEMIGRLHVEGPNLHVDLLEFRRPSSTAANRQSEIPAALHTSSTLSVDDKGPVTNKHRDIDTSTIKVIESPIALPYYEFDRENFRKSFNIQMYGEILEPFEKYFVINFCNTHGKFDGKKENVPAHISLRVNQNRIIRNSLANGTWGNEQAQLMVNEYPFRIGSKFSIEIIFSTDDNKLRFLNKENDQELFQIYMEPSQSKLIDTLEINGSIKLDRIRYQFF